nr:MAG TPA: Polyhomeotic-like protein 1 BINDING PROTEIN [Caudoviricetes sp.]
MKRRVPRALHATTRNRQGTAAWSAMTQRGKGWCSAKCARRMNHGDR